MDSVVIPNAMKLDRDSKVTGPSPQKYVPRSKIRFVPSSSTRNCSVLHAFSSPFEKNMIISNIEPNA